MTDTSQEIKDIQLKIRLSPPGSEVEFQVGIIDFLQLVIQKKAVKN